MNWLRRLFYVEPRYFVFFVWRTADGVSGNAHVSGPIYTVADFERVIAWLHAHSQHPGAAITITGLYRINP